MAVNNQTNTNQKQPSPLDELLNSLAQGLIHLAKYGGAHLLSKTYELIKNNDEARAILAGLGFYEPRAIEFAKEISEKIKKYNDSLERLQDVIKKYDNIPYSIREDLARLYQSCRKFKESLENPYSSLEETIVYGLRCRNDFKRIKGNIDNLGPTIVQFSEDISRYLSDLDRSVDDIYKTLIQYLESNKELKGLILWLADLFSKKY